MTNDKAIHHLTNKFVLQRYASISGIPIIPVGHYSEKGLFECSLTKKRGGFLRLISLWVLTTGGCEHYYYSSFLSVIERMLLKRGLGSKKSQLLIIT